MTSIFENLTKVPSQVLVNSASTFGEKAAQIISAHAESAIKSSSDHLVREMKDSTDKISNAVSEGLSDFGDVIHRTGVEGFTEWGIGIERAFLHLGHKLEMGLSNGSQKLSIGMSQSIDENTKQITETLASSTDVLAESIGEFGIIQAKEIHHEFRWEIIVLTWCFVSIAFSSLVFALTLFSRSELLALLIHLVSKNAGAVAFIFLSILIGYLAYASQQSVSSQQVTTSSSTTMTHRKQPIYHPGILVTVIGAVGFALGQLSHSAFSSSSFSTIFAILILLLSAFFSFYTFSYALLAKVYAVYRTILDFKTFYQEHQKRLNDGTTTSAETNESSMENGSTHESGSATDILKPKPEGTSTSLNSTLKPQTTMTSLKTQSTTSRSNGSPSLSSQTGVKHRTFASMINDTESSSTSDDSP